VKMHQGVREKIAQLACYRETIAAHLAASIEMAQESPGGLLMPDQALLYTGRVHACSQLPGMMHLVRDLCGCQISLVPSAEAFRAAGSGEWLSKYFRVGDIEAEDRRKMLAYARDLLNSDYAGHRLTFQLFAQSPPFSHLLAVYNNYDFGPAVDRMAKSAGLKEPLRLRSEALA
jgi:4-hydroxyphenylacetate 3-monooxygenase